MRVVWLDPTGDHESWLNVSEALKRKPRTVTTLGFFLYDSPDLVIVASSRLHGADAVGGVTAIPRGCIVSIKELP